MEMHSQAGIRGDLVADVPTAATPIVALFSYHTSIPMITPREEKTHGSGASIDGVFEAGQTVILIDDLVTKADSKLNAIKTLESKGLIVKDVMVLVDRQQGGAAELAARGYNLHSAFTISELLDYYLEAGFIPRVGFDEIKAYFAANR